MTVQLASCTSKLALLTQTKHILRSVARRCLQERTIELALLRSRSLNHDAAVSVVLDRTAGCATAMMIVPIMSTAYAPPPLALTTRVATAPFVPGAEAVSAKKPVHARMTAPRSTVKPEATMQRRRPKRNMAQPERNVQGRKSADLQLTYVTRLRCHVQKLCMQNITQNSDL